MLTCSKCLQNSLNYLNIIKFHIQKKEPQGFFHKAQMVIPSFHPMWNKSGHKSAKMQCQASIGYILHVVYNSSIRYSNETKVTT